MDFHAETNGVGLARGGVPEHGNPALGIPSLLGMIPGMSRFVTKRMERRMEAIDLPPLPEFIQLVADSGVTLYACKASVDMMGLEREDFVDDLAGVISVGEFYTLAAGGQIIFT